MLILGKSESYKWPVTVEIAVDGGRYERAEFVAEFRRLPQSRLDEIAQTLRADGEIITDAALAEEVLAGWDRIKDADGQPIPFTTANRAAVLDIPGVRTALVVTFFESVSGGRRKN